MFLYFSLVASDGTISGPCVCSAEIEIQMEVLNSFVAIGNVLLSAYLMDEDGFRIDLPVEAFDGLPVANRILSLTKQYQQVLSA